MRKFFFLLVSAIFATLILANSNLSVKARAPPLASIDIPAKVDGHVPPEDDLLAIQRTMSLYPFVLDGKAWDQLDRIFHPDIWANYSGYIGIVQSLPNVSEALSSIMAPVTSQHALTTQLIQVSANGSTANSWTYYWANHFGTGDMYGEALWTWGTYEDFWVKNFSSGEWRILGRQNLQMGPWFGNTSVLRL